MRSPDKSVDDQWPDEAKPLELAGAERPACLRAARGRLRCSPRIPKALRYVEVGLSSGISDLSTFVPFAFFIAFLSVFIFLSIFDLSVFLPILRILFSEHHNHWFNLAWGDSFLTAELLSPSELL
jgi:hypothetical protein